MDWKTLVPQLLLTAGLIFLGAFAHALKTYLKDGITALRQYWGPNSWRPTLWTLITIIGSATVSVLTGQVTINSGQGILALFLLGFAINSSVNTPSDQVKTTTGAPGTPLTALLGALLLLGLFVPNGAQASTKITLNCSAPTTRTDNSVFTAAEIGGYLFFYTQPAATQVAIPPLALAPTCTRDVPIAKGTCFKKGTVFAVTVTDKSSPALTSDPGVATLDEDVCNPLAKPAAPVVTITHD